MNRLLLTAVLCSTTALPAFAQVGVSVSIGEPGFFGQLEIGSTTPPPEVIYPQPVIVQPATVVEPPVYLRVPPGYERDWAHHCREYNACGRRVFFVKDDWYNRAYVPHYRQAHPERFAPPPREEEHREREHDHDRDRDGDREHDRHD